MNAVIISAAKSVPLYLQPNYERIDKMDDDTRGADFGRALGGVAGCLNLVAAHVCWMENHHIDTRGLQMEIPGYIYAIARGNLLPEVVVKLWRKKRLFDIVSKLSVEQQAECVKGKLKVARLEGGEWTHALVEAAEMKPWEMQRVFDRDSETPHIRNVEEQKNWAIREPEGQIAPTVRAKPVVRYEFVRKPRGGKLNGEFWPLKELKKIVADIEGRR